MPAAATATCSRCGHEPTHLAKPFAAWRLAIRRGPAWEGLVVVVYNLLVAVLVPRRPVCSWCHARRTPRAQRSYGLDPFVHSFRHSRDAMVLRRRAAALRPHPSTGRWDRGDRAEILAYLASRDEGRCGLCALPLPVAEGQVEHVVPKKFGLFDFSRGSARAGQTLESMLHHVDNLQMAHEYCNRAKGNTPSAVKWRHPMLPSLPVARQVGTPLTYLWVPERDAGNERLQAPGDVGSRRNDPVGGASVRRPVPGGGGRHSPARRTGGGSGSRRSALTGIGGALFWFGVAGVALVAVLLMPRCLSSMTGSGDRAEPGTTAAAPPGPPSATSAEPQEAPQRPEASPQPPADESDPQPIPPTTVSESERSIEEPERGESTDAAADEVISDAAPGGGEVLGDGRVGELDGAAVAALSVVVAAARSVDEAEGGFAGASVAALEGMGLTVPATSELAQATGEEEVPLMFSDQAAGRTPWEVSVLAPNPGDSGALAVWAVAVRSPVACRVVVLDPDWGSWASTTGTVGYSPCDAGAARNSYLERRGVGGERSYFHWVPATPDPVTGDEPPAAEAS